MEHPGGLEGEIRTHTSKGGDIYNWQENLEGDVVSIMGVRIPVVDLLDLAEKMTSMHHATEQGAEAMTEFGE